MGLKIVPKIERFKVCGDSIPYDNAETKVTVEIILNETGWTIEKIKYEWEDRSYMCKPNNTKDYKIGEPVSEFLEFIWIDTGLYEYVKTKDGICKYYEEDDNKN